MAIGRWIQSFFGCLTAHSELPITADLQLDGVRTPFLLDDGTGSRAYGTLGNGVHPGPAGHSSS